MLPVLTVQRMPTATIKPVHRTRIEEFMEVETLFPFDRYRFLAVALLANFLALAILSSYGSCQEGSSKPKPKSTPEQRAEAKAREGQRAQEAAIQRQQMFGALPPNDDSPLAKEYEIARDRFREALTNLDEARNRQQLATDFSTAKQNEILDNWLKAIAEGNKALEAWLLKSGELYESDPEKYQLIGETLGEILLNDVEFDRFDPWLAPAKALVNGNKMLAEAQLLAAGMVGVANADFDFARKCWQPLNDKGLLKGADALYFKELESMQEKWKRELEIRQQESIKGDNPLVELTTSKGRITVELYEDSAPEAVSSFIYLIEKGYYDRKSFFRVEKHVCAQTGCEKGDGTGDPGYVFAGEASLPNHRDHFRGTLSVALGSDKDSGIVNANSGGAQVFFSFMPMPFLDGTYTVFGRIVEGQPSINLFRVMNLADEEQRKDESKRPDVILKGKVLRKRDHEYVPKILAGKLYR
jgi:cyclophilin family peptidyl-prolyl cis-trans isomerase